MTRWSFEPEEELVTVRVFASQSEFLLARAALESADIECFARDEHAMRISGGLHRSGAAEGFALQVRKTDAEDARAILDAPPLDESYIIEE